MQNLADTHSPLPVPLNHSLPSSLSFWQAEALQHRPCPQTRFWNTKIPRQTNPAMTLGQQSLPVQVPLVLMAKWDRFTPPQINLPRYFPAGERKEDKAGHAGAPLTLVGPSSALSLS